MQDGLIRSMTRKSASILRVYSHSLLGDNKRAVGYHSTRRPSRTVASWHAPTRSRSMSSEVGEVHHEKAARQLTRWNIGGPRADQVSEHLLNVGDVLPRRFALLKTERRIDVFGRHLQRQDTGTHSTTGKRGISLAQITTGDAPRDDELVSCAPLIHRKHRPTAMHGDRYGASPELFTLLCKRIAQAVPPCVEGESAPVILHLGMPLFASRARTSALVRVDSARREPRAGCGTSALSATLSQSLSGRRVLHSDFSMPGLEVMRARHPLLAWAGMDARALPLRDASVAAVVEKGTMDALLRSGEDDWNDMAKEMLRVLRPGGVFLQVTDEAPELRLPLLEFHQPRWQACPFPASARATCRCVSDDAPRASTGLVLGAAC